ncbi:MAG: RNA-binding transcriptional accessory protein, partial [Deltaproteobacteria bacterium]|nr:RNA-binding transcriptional accessory protein [Deltaproteobacteria bacterium]
MNKEHITKITKELKLTEKQVSATAKLFEEDATIPFIARYRKEATGSLDETIITTIRDRLNQLKELDKRREAILKSLEERDLLTDELKEKIMAAETMSVLEDIYLPFKPKRRTRAIIAKEKRLGPLAQLIFQQGDIDPISEAKYFIDKEKGVETVEDALQGTRDIIAEWVSEDQKARAKIRNLFAEKGIVRSKVNSKKEEEAIKYKDYYEWEE